MHGITVVLGGNTGVVIGNTGIGWWHVSGNANGGGVITIGGWQYVVGGGNTIGVVMVTLLNWLVRDMSARVMVVAL